MLVDDSHVYFLCGPADATRPDLARLATGCNDTAAAGFRHRPCLQQRKTEARFERSMELLVDAGAKAEPNGMRLVQLRRLGPHQHRRHDAQIVQAGRPARAYGIPPTARVEAIESPECRKYSFVST